MIAEEKIEKLKEEGRVPTIQRLAVLEFMEGNLGHPTVEEVYRGLKDRYPSLSQATVYSTLELLRDLGLLRELTILRSKVCYDSIIEAHHHFSCKACGRVFDVAVDCAIPKKDLIQGNKVDEFQAYIYGTCSNCLEG
ncbi:MAG: transcriptional repressor [Actinomycetota bacterium]|nr:transcriptional repressor [Actinomycetota bacterium]